MPPTPCSRGTYELANCSKETPQARYSDLHDSSIAKREMAIAPNRQGGRVSAMNIALPTFPSDTQSVQFVAWLAERLPSVRVRLDIKAWKGAPRVQAEVQGIEAVLARYSWPTK